MTFSRLMLTGAAVATLAAVACGGERFGAGSYSGYVLKPPFTKPAVVWQRADGTPFDMRKETAGHVTLLFFGYTHCPDICPMQLVNIAGAFQKLGADTAAMVRVLFVTVDPARDTGQVLAHWVHAIDPRFVALRGPMASVTAEQARLGLAPPADIAESGAEPQPSKDPPHASAVIAFARDDSAHFMYPPNVNAAAWARDLRKLVRAGPQ